MKYNIENKKMKTYLDELGEEYKDLLFSKLIEDSYDIENLNISDLLRIDSECKKFFLQNEKRARTMRKMLFIMGMLYIFLAIIFNAMFTDIDAARYEVSSNLLTMLTFFLGILSILLSFGFNFLKSHKATTREHKNNINIGHEIPLTDYIIISKWKELELLSREVNGDFSNNNTPGDSIRKLASNIRISDDDVLVLKKFLTLRNSIVHSTKENIDRDEIYTLLNKVDKLIDKLNRLIAK